MTAPLSARRILLVDDDASVRMTFAALLEDAGAQVFEAATIDHAVTLISCEQLDLAILDLHLEGRLGTELVPPLRAQHPGVRIALLTGEDAGTGHGVDLVLLKGDDPGHLTNELAALTEGRARRRPTDENVAGQAPRGG